jgi:propanol-preferring alcohol dehydrogenase
LACRPSTSSSVPAPSRAALTGSSVDNEDNLGGFAVRSGIRSQNEVYPLTEAPAAYARMASGGARYRVVLDATR